MVKATPKRTYVKLLVKLSQFCYGFKDIRTYRKSSEGVKVTVKAVQRSTVALRALTTFIIEYNLNRRQCTYKSNLAFHACLDACDKMADHWIEPHR